MLIAFSFNASNDTILKNSNILHCKLLQLQIMYWLVTYSYFVSYNSKIKTIWGKKERRKTEFISMKFETIYVTPIDFESSNNFKISNMMFILLLLCVCWLDHRIPSIGSSTMSITYKYDLGCSVNMILG